MPKKAGPIMIKRYKLQAGKFANGVNRWSGLTRERGYFLEKQCLRRIAKTYQCICRRKAYHFPRIVGCNDKTQTLYLTNCGISMNSFHPNSGSNFLMKKKHKNVKLINIEEQIACIIHNLKRAKVKHLDMYLKDYEGGKNICVNNFGHISLIDFDTASMDNICLTHKIERKLEYYGGHKEYYSKLRVIMRKIITKLQYFIK